ncbi:MAG: PDZ domain-containing protein [Vicinamibacterales bacterium]|jgi:membrane-associated protease RseP (regulator of RpoE activity)|nr:PDZ domain-containing protein [Vicinamibacterales bacterium]
MRPAKTIGMAMVLLVAGALATLWQAPLVAAAGQQTASQNQQAEKPKVEKQTITVRKSTGGKPMVVTVEGEPGQDPKVMTHMIQGEPMIAALGGGPRLGIEIRDLGKEDLAKFKLSSQQGVAVEQVTKDSAAEKAGVKAGDVVVQFDGENVRSAAQLTRLVRETVAGRTVKMAVMRDGKRMDLDVAPAEAENEFAQQLLGERRTPAPGGTFTWEERVPAPGQPIPPMQPIPPGGAPRWQQRTPIPVPEGDILQWHGEGNWPGAFSFTVGRSRLGVNVQELTPELAAYFGVKDGLLVNSVKADSPAAKAGFRAGDVIGAVNGKAVTMPDELIKELADKEGDVTIGVTRDKKALSLKATLEPRKAPARRTVVVGRPA